MRRLNRSHVCMHGEPAMFTLSLVADLAAYLSAQLFTPAAASHTLRT